MADNWQLMLDGNFSLNSLGIYLSMSARGWPDVDLLESVLQTKYLCQKNSRHCGLADREILRQI